MRFTSADAIETAERMVREERYPSALLRPMPHEMSSDDSVWRLLGMFFTGVLVDLLRPRSKSKLR